MAQTGLATLVGTRWVGAGELWLDPLGNEAHRYDCTMTISDGSVRYTWSHEGKPHEGVFTLRKAGASWSDSWHQPNAVECSELSDALGLLVLQYAYPVSAGADWRWRTTLSERPSGELVLQMTNVAPWGEEQRAVRMVFTRKS
jgi:hypothetical protein